ncbi:MAG TPA: nucleotidyltransferase domain-containing protein [Patescibacteria group bacterium]
MTTTMNGRRSMQAALPNFSHSAPSQPPAENEVGNFSPVMRGEERSLENAIISTLAFFSLYDLPITSRRLHELLLDYSVEFSEIETVLEILASDNRIYKTGNLYSLKAWKAADLRDRQVEISKKWYKIDRYFNWLAMLPYVRLVSVINSLAMGTADSDSDIDFFVVTEKNRLYFVRSIIIVMFRMLGVYKTRQKIRDKFCFGFFVSTDNLNFESLLIKPKDPYFVFWLANMRPILGGQQYWQLIQDNSWLGGRFPNLIPMQRLASVKQPNFFIKSIKLILEILLFVPAVFLEPILRRIHIKHTFKLAENNTTSSTTIANAKMLKLHGLDVRAQVAQAHERVLQNLR